MSWKTPFHLAQVAIRFVLSRNRKIAVILGFYAVVMFGSFLMFGIGNLVRNPGSVGSLVHAVLGAMMWPLGAAVVLPVLAAAIQVAGGPAPVVQLFRAIADAGAWLLEGCVFLAVVALALLSGFAMIAFPATWIYAGYMALF